MMRQKLSARLLKKAVLHGAVLAGLAVGIASSAQPAWAQLGLSSPPIQTSDGQQTTIMSALTMAIGSIQAKLQDLTSQNVANTVSANGARDAEANAVSSSAMSHAIPAGQSWCNEAGSSVSRDDNNSQTAAMAGAMTQAGGKRPDSPAMNAQELQAEMADGLVPCTTTGDVEGLTYKALKCTTPAWGETFVGADLSMDVLFGSYSAYGASTDNGQNPNGPNLALLPAGFTGDTQYEFPVPPGFGVLTTGKYQPIPVVKDAKYMPFVAAYSFCQRINPRRKSLPPPANGTATGATMVAGQKNDADAKLTAAYSMCIKFLNERLQFDVANYPSLNKSQALECDQKLKSNWFDQPNDQYCDQYGRSTLQALHDADYEDEFATFKKVYLQSPIDDTTKLMHDMENLAHDNFDTAKIDTERAELTAALTGVAVVGTVPVDSPLSVPAQ